MLKASFWCLNVFSCWLNVLYHIIALLRLHKNPCHLCYFPCLEAIRSRTHICSCFSKACQLLILFSDSILKNMNNSSTLKPKIQGCYLWDKSRSCSTHAHAQEADKDSVCLNVDFKPRRTIFIAFFSDNSYRTGCVCFRFLSLQKTVATPPQSSHSSYCTVLPKSHCHHLQ